MLVTNIFSFSHNVFYPIRVIDHHFSYYDFVVCKCFELVTARKVGVCYIKQTTKICIEEHHHFYAERSITVKVKWYAKLPVNGKFYCRVNHAISQHFQTE